MVEIVVYAVATARLHTTQVCGYVFDADRKRGGGGKSYHLTEKQLLCHLFFTAISNRSADIFKQHSNSDNVWRTTLVLNEMSMANKHTQKGKASRRTSCPKLR